VNMKTKNMKTKNKKELHLVLAFPNVPGFLLYLQIWGLDFSVGQ
jgi:hypothetical protein